MAKFQTFNAGFQLEVFVRQLEGKHSLSASQTVKLLLELADDRMKEVIRNEMAAGQQNHRTRVLPLPQEHVAASGN